MHKTFCSPSKYIQGINATQLLGAEMTVMGLSGPVLIVASPSPLRILEATWRKTFAEAKIAFTIHTFAGECTHAEVKRIVAAATAAKCQAIVGAGGGKVLDAARSAAASIKVPFISCPTIATTDSPCCAISVIYNEAGVVEESQLHRTNPALVLVDTQVIAEAPTRMLVAGMGDALSTLFEARACIASKSSNMRGGSCTQVALVIAELCYKTLLADGVEALRSAREKMVTPALERIIEANTLLSGLGFESAGLAAAHSVHNGLTVAPGTHDFLHGEKVAFGVIAHLMLEKATPAQIDEVLNFSYSVGLPMTLSDIGCANMSSEMLAKVAARATIPGEWIHQEPFAVTSKMVEDAILAADAAGRAFKAKRASA